MAQCNLAAMYAEGEGTAKDMEAAFKWYEAAAMQGNALAQYNIATLLLNGSGTKTDIANGLNWLMKSAKQDWAPAQNMLGTLYSTGKNVAKSPETALFWFNKAVSSGYTAAQYNLGLFWLWGLNGKSEPAQAMTLFEQAATQGHADATYWLGVMHEKGLGVSIDIGQARSFYIAARDLGSQAAGHALLRLNASGDTTPPAQTPLSISQIIRKSSGNKVSRPIPVTSPETEPGEAVPHVSPGDIRKNQTIPQGQLSAASVSESTSTDSKTEQRQPISAAPAIDGTEKKSTDVPASPDASNRKVPGSKSDDTLSVPLIKDLTVPVESRTISADPSISAEKKPQ